MGMSNQLVEHVREIKEDLERIERELPEVGLPSLLLDDFRRALDHLRNTLWAISTASERKPGEINRAIVQFRIQRTTEMCERIIRRDIASQRIAVDTPNLIKLNSVLNEMHGSIRKLFAGDSAAPTCRARAWEKPSKRSRFAYQLPLPIVILRSASSLTLRQRRPLRSRNMRISFGIIESPHASALSSAG